MTDTGIPPGTTVGAGGQPIPRRKQTSDAYRERLRTEVLAILGSHGPLRMTDLVGHLHSRRVFVSDHLVVQCRRELENDGLITCHTVHSPHRGLWMRLTGPEPARAWNVPDTAIVTAARHAAHGLAPGTWIDGLEERIHDALVHVVTELGGTVTREYE